MIGRYQIVRGKRPPGNPLPEGHRQDTRKHTRHVLRPDAARVVAFLDAPSDAAWRSFAAAYRKDLQGRLREGPAAFEALADLARTADVWLGCSCPTAKNPDVRRCHTYLALEFLQKRFPDLEIRWPESTSPPGA